MTKKTKNLFITLAFVLIAAIAFAALARVNGIITNRKVTQLEYGIGMVSIETGKVGESNQSVYLKDLQKVNGAEIALDDNATATVKVFYYDRDNAFISSSTNLDLSEAPEGAVYFRVMITPALVDGEPVTVSLLNISRYTDQVRIVVSK